MHLLDYVVFIIVLIISAFLGLYISCFQRKQKLSTGRQYLFGDGKITGIPLGLSWYSSMVPATMILGIPTEVYTFGTQIIVGCIGNVAFIPFLHYVIVPVFCGPLVMKSPFEYYELRFNAKIRFLASVIHSLHSIFFLPSLLFSAVFTFCELTKTDFVFVSTVVGIICITYTALGGYPGVIWTDIFQTIIMWLSFVVILIITCNLYSFPEIWNRADLGGRLIFFNMDPSPFVRWTFWGSVVGNGFISLAVATSTGTAMQRLISCADQKQATISIVISNFAKMFTKINLCLIGVFMYGHYYGCDPVKNKDVQSANELLPYFISDLMSGLPGFNGLFAGGLLSAGLSTLSSELNTTAGVLYYDILGKIFKRFKLTSEREDKNIMIFLVFLLGIFTLFTAPLYQHIHYLVPVMLTIAGIGAGLLLGLLLLGIMLPWVNNKGALFGTVVSVTFMVWINIGSMLYNNENEFALPISTESCPSNNITELQITTPAIIPTNKTEPFILYRISFLYSSLLTTIIQMIVGIIVSYFTGFTDTTKLNAQLIMPCLRKFTNELQLKNHTNENTMESETL